MNNDPRLPALRRIHQQLNMLITPQDDATYHCLNGVTALIRDLETASPRKEEVGTAA